MIKKIFILILFPAFYISCYEQVDIPVDNRTMDHWISDVMDTVYYWNTQLPPNSDLNLLPEKYFKSILFKDDRFSWIDKETTSNLKSYYLNNSKSYGYNLKLYYISNNSNYLVAQILYVQKNSPADKAGLKRGDLFDAVNGSKLTVNNYTALLDPKIGTISINTVYYSSSYGIFKPLKVVSLTSEVIDQNPIIIDTIYNISSYKIGYLLYYQFISDPDDGSLIYDKKLEDIFAGFRQSGVNRLIIDLRFNLGGLLSTCRKLGSLILKNSDTTKIFLKCKYNNLMDSILRSQYGSDYFNIKFLDEPNNLGNNINSVTFITSNNTASASEALINGLRPYMPVYLIGDTTVGKNLGSITISSTLKNTKWILQPIVFKVFNSLDQSDYSNGLSPDIYLLDGGLNILPLGSTSEKLLSAAITNYTGITLKSITIKTEDEWPFAIKSFKPAFANTDIPFLNLVLNRKVLKN
jgi:carboxyl-terminal processing protease